MGIEEFSTGDSWAHRLDPRVKIVVALAFSIVTALIQGMTAALIAPVFPLLLLVAARLNPLRVLSRLAVVNGFLFFLLVFMPFTVPGTVVGSIGPFQVHKEGLVAAAALFLKSNAIMMALIALLGTTPVFTLVHAMSHLWVPDKLVHLFFFCFRYLHVIHDEFHRLVRAMKIRGFRPRTDMHTYRSYANLAAMVLISSYDRSKRVLAAMKCRGFKGRFYIMHDYEMKRGDAAQGAAGLGVMGVLVVMWW
jgi:cobalt/nickel transport system permease protein